MKAKRFLLVGLLLITIVLGPSNLPGCGPFFDRPLFVGVSTPLEPMNDYVAGRLGVLQPTWWRMYLFVAYRHLSGKPLTEPERQAFLGFAGEESVQPSAVKEWIDARGKVAGAGVQPRIDIFRQLKGNSWQSYVNCTDESLRSAAKTLDERIKTFGASHPGIKGWVSAQDSVFSDCSQGESIPPPAEQGLSQILRADRNYQIAAAHFYSEHYDEAARLFRDIAADAHSPWSQIAPYLVARCMIRKSTISAPEGQIDKTGLAAAEAQLQSLLRDQTRSALHPAVQNLLNFVALRLNPLARMRALAQDLRKAGDAGFAQDLTDYLYLMDRIGSPQLNLESAHQTNEMTDWILTFQQAGAAALVRSLAKWKEGGDIAWLLSSIVKIPFSDPESAALADAALRVPKDSPAYATAAYHRIRLLIASGKNEQARESLDSLLPDLHNRLPPSSLNLFLAQRMTLARNLEEFLRFAPRETAGITDMSERQATAPDEKEERILFDVDSLKVFNQGLPLAMLQRAAATSSLPPHLRRQLLSAAWVRAILLSDEKTARALAPDLERDFPEFKSDLRAYLSAIEPEPAQFAAAGLLLRFPGLSPVLKSWIPIRKELSGINEYRENWWCSVAVEGDLDRLNFSRYAYGTGYKTQAKELYIPGFLTGEEKSALEREWKLLLGLGAGPDYLGRVVLNWARKHPDDARVPEALYQAVRATRFGCNDSESWRYSRDAFRFLHTRYPNSQWARMTPFWFK